MRRILTSVVLLVLLFPALASGGEVTMDDLVETNGLYFKKFTDVPFSGKTTGKIQGTFRNGKEHGPWVGYWDNGRLRSKGTFKDGKRDGLWVGYYDNGQVRSQGTYKDGEKDGLRVYYHEDGTVNEEWTGTFGNSRKVKPACPSDQTKFYTNCVGTFKWENGDKYVGEFMNNKRHGQGTFIRPNGDKYVGEWANDDWSGYGAWYGKDGNVVFKQFRERDGSFNMIEYEAIDRCLLSIIGKRQQDIVEPTSVENAVKERCKQELEPLSAKEVDNSYGGRVR